MKTSGLYDNPHRTSSILGCGLTSIGNDVMEMKQSWDQLISMIWFPVLIGWHHYIETSTGLYFNIKMLSWQCRKSHCGDKTVVRSSYLHNGISYTCETISLYWIGAQVSKAHNTSMYGLPQCNMKCNPSNQSVSGFRLMGDLYWKWESMVQSWAGIVMTM